MKRTKSNLETSSQSSKSLCEYLKKKGENHNNYKYYATLDRIKEIKDNKVLYLSRGTDWNDKNDVANFSKAIDNTVQFGKCFSFSMTENVAMWMLYGGIHGNGGMINFTKKDIKAIMTQTHKIELGHFDNDEFICESTLEGSFEIFVTDVLYIHKDSKNCRLSRADENHSGVSIHIIDEIPQYTKSYPWHYENECRLIIRIDKNKVPNSCTNIKIDLNEIGALEYLKYIYTSPIYKGDKIDGITSSELTEVNWDLCQNCKK